MLPEQETLHCIEPNPIWDYTYAENLRYWLNVYGETVYNRAFRWLWFVPFRKWRMAVSRRIADYLVYDAA